MGIVFKNNAKTTLASNLSNSATSATVTDGSVFPSLSAGEFFLITFDDGSNNEICKCTARSGNTLTIVRAQESTTARAFSSGDAAEGRVTAGVLETIQENIAAKSANQTVFNTTTAGGATTYNIGTNPGVEANAMVFLNGVLQHHDTISFSGTNLTFDAAPPNGMALEVIIDNLINLQSSNLTVDSFTAADVSGNPQTDFTLSDTPAAETNLIVFVDGVFQDQDAYTISSNTLTITTGVIAGRGVTVYVINPVNIGTPSDSTVTSAKLSGNITMPGTLTVGSNDVAFDSPTFVVDHTNSRVGLGTASPSVPVDIVGEVKTSSHINIGGNLVKASGDLTLDVAGDIILDADGDDIKIAEGGTVVMEIKHESSSIDFSLNTGDEDFKFKGIDGGSTITALQLDMSEAGKALFNKGATFNELVTIDGGSTANTVLALDSSTANTFLKISDSNTNEGNFIGCTTDDLTFFTRNTERLRIDSAGTIYQRTTTPTLHSAQTGIVLENGSLLTDITRSAGKSISLAQNAAVDSGNTWAYLATDEASLFQQFGGNHYFKTAASGSAGADITFDTKMFIANAGNVGIGDNNPSYKLSVSGTGGTRIMVENTDTNWAALDIRAGGNQANYIFFKDDSAERARIQVFDSNDVAVSTGDSPSEKLRLLAAGGLTFNGDTAAANALDDYEEGTFTPACSALSVTVQSAKYTKVGDLVTVVVYLEASVGNGTSGAANFTGLPFTSVSDGWSVGPLSVATGNSSISGNPLHVRVVANASTIDLKKNNDTTMIGSEIDAGHIIWTVSYKAA